MILIPRKNLFFNTYLLKFRFGLKTEKSFFSIADLIIGLFKYSLTSFSLKPKYLVIGHCGVSIFMSWKLFKADSVSYLPIGKIPVKYARDTISVKSDLNNF